jgi:hypothetical protein
MRRRQIGGEESDGGGEGFFLEYQQRTPSCPAFFDGLGKILNSGMFSSAGGDADIWNDDLEISCGRLEPTELPAASVLPGRSRLLACLSKLSERDRSAAQSTSAKDLGFRNASR